MVTCKLIRYETSDQGTFGRFYVGEAGQAFYSGELPCRNNESALSSIPVGTYQCQWLFSPHHQRNVYHVMNVPNREAVEIHSGNFCGDTTKGFKSDVLGCLLLGNQKGIAGQQEAVLDSKAAIAHFESVMNGEEFTLEVSEAYSSAA